MDSTVTSSTGIFSNVSSGYHFIQVFDANGQNRFASLNLGYGGVQWRAAFETISNSCTITSVATYKLNVTGGQPPFTYRINNDSLVTTTNSFTLQPQRVYKVVIEDAVGCATTLYLQTTPAQYFELSSDFTPNSCGDSVGTVKLKINTNLTLTTPLNISFNSRPFSSDTAFTNIRPRGFSYLVIVKTRDCGEKVVSTYPFPQRPLSSIREGFIVTDCPARKGNLYVNMDYGGAPPYRFTLNGQSERVQNNLSTVIWENLKVDSLYTIRVRSAEGCDVSKTIVAKENYTDRYYYDAVCGQAGTFYLYPQSGRKYTIDNQLLTLDFLNRYVRSNVLQGQHLLRMTDTAGCFIGDTTLTLYARNSFNLSLTRANGTCSDSLFRINLSGGVAPYTYAVRRRWSNELLAAVNAPNVYNFKPNEYYDIEVKDANYCRFDSTFVVNKVDSVRITTTFTSQNCNSSLVDLRIAVPDTNAARPLNISFNGRPFSADTFFTNVPTAQSYAVLVKSKLGCDMRSIFYIPRTNAALNIFVNDTCANRFGRGRFTVNLSGGTPPYSYQFPFGNPNADLAVGTYNITVTDATGCSVIKTATIWSCVWSGDTDTSGLVDNRDLLNIGVAFGETGPVTCIDSVRNPFCTLWYGRKAQNWSKQTAAGTNFKHIDTNGDGIVNARDTLAITRNWNFTHALRNPNTPTATERSAVPPIFVQTSAVREGDIVSFPIMLGEASATADNIYGLAFSVKYPPSVIEPNSMRLMVNQSWMGASSELLKVFKDEFDNVFHVGLVKTNKLNSTGSGQIVISCTLSSSMRAIRR